MSGHGWLLLTLFMLVLLACAIPLGLYIAKLADNAPLPYFNRAEQWLYRCCGVRPEQEMSWLHYCGAILLFNIAGLLALMLLQFAQGALPLNPANMGAVTWHSALNTAVSFVANTNWQGYAGESTMSYLTQMLGLAVQNFLSAATGIAVVIALIRGLVRHNATTLGNAWVDLTRSTVYLLLPLSVLWALLFISQGVIQNFSAYVDVTTLEGAKQTLAMGPVASQEAIKLLGTNGGGFFNANSAHPFENPTAFANFLQMLAIFIIPAALCFAFGKMVKDMRQGWTVYAAMAILFVVFAITAIYAEQQANPVLTALGMESSSGNMEGKEVRFGIADSALFTAVTTGASCGAVNNMHDSLTPLGGAVPTVLMQLGEVVFGGVGSGLYGMLIFAILAVFISGLMIGRTPEYLGKKIEKFEMQMVSIVILVTPMLVLFGTALAVMTEAGRVGVANPGAHGFSEILYALTSAANNNGSAFAGLSANTVFYNLLLAFAMWFGRFGVIVPVLAIAGSLARKKRLSTGLGTLPTHGALFSGLLIGVVLLVGLLNYVPALALGPIVEHLMLFSSH
ncbi:MAG: potassium-transporting ATPase subunit KdpA [Cellvibrionales bacterium]|nr:potassium-transporting ATPase subunit KdpA [Cellvibrionales bacterium]MBK8676811.1 potassium-transporting ATPase subunit KdpA [Cellvibrionales bacterium]